MDKTCPYEGIPELLSFWKAQGVKLAVFSNKADEFSKEIVEHYFPGVFDAIRGTVKEVPIKPDPAGVYLLMEELGVSKEETRFIGDSDVDILTGHNAGLQALGVTWGFRSRDCLKQAGADRIADDPQELSELLGK